MKKSVVYILILNLFIISCNDDYKYYFDGNIVDIETNTPVDDARLDYGFGVSNLYPGTTNSNDQGYFSFEVETPSEHLDDIKIIISQSDYDTLIIVSDDEDWFYDDDFFSGLNIECHFGDIEMMKKTD